MENLLYSFVQKVFMGILILLLSCLFTLPVFAQNTHSSLPNNYPQTMVKLSPCYKTPASLKHQDTLHIQGLGYGEYVDLKVMGTIQNVRLVQLVYNETNDTFEEFMTIATIPTVSNQSLVISTYFPCGIPQEKLIWESLSGKEDCFIIAEDGKTGLKPILYTYEDPFEMPQLITPPALPIHFISPTDIPVESALYFMVPLFY